MAHILSIQSHVAYGYVGNRAAVFPLQRLGFDVTAVNTVQFSNHTGYGAWRGDVMSVEHITNVIQGLRERDLLSQFSAVVTGYMGDSALGEVVLQTVAEIRLVNPELIYCCDPVMGDVGRGFFVRPGLPEFFKEHLTPRADIITPNKFEAEYLSGMTIDTLDAALAACVKLTNAGSSIVLITSLETAETPENTIQMLAYSANEKYLITTPKFAMSIAPNGSGDATTAIFLGDYLQHKNLARALQHAANSIYGIFKQTYEDNTRELQIISAQEEIAHPSENFTFAIL